jgi:predicted nucleic acid-binding protein
MKALLDLNVVLDVVQKREPHYAPSAAVIEAAIQRQLEGFLPAHAVTTLHYIVNRYRSRTIANRAVDWLLRYFDIATVGREELLRARALDWKNFEDAVVAAAAEARACDAIITRNVRDFRHSTVPVLTPEEYLLST